MGNGETKHIVYNGNEIGIHCCCGNVENRNCTVNDLDLSILHAILKTCNQNRITSHVVWLDKIVEEK